MILGYTDTCTRVEISRRYWAETRIAFVETVDTFWVWMAYSGVHLRNALPFRLIRPVLNIDQLCIRERVEQSRKIDATEAMINRRKVFRMVDRFEKATLLGISEFEATLEVQRLRRLELYGREDSDELR